MKDSHGSEFPYILLKRSCGWLISAYLDIDDFWAGAKQAPSPIKFDSSNPLHIEFVVACANLRAFNYGLQGMGQLSAACFHGNLCLLTIFTFTGRTDVPFFVSILKDTKVPEFEPVKGLHIPTSDREITSVVDNSVDTQFTDLVQSLPLPSTLAGYRLQPVSFEKVGCKFHHYFFIIIFSCFTN
jgi:ubiquitin-activating enzyme E1